jgi:hypothetical protein
MVGWDIPDAWGLNIFLDIIVSVLFVLVGFDWGREGSLGERYG